MSLNNTAVYLQHMGMIATLGSDPATIRQRLRGEYPCLTVTDRFSPGRPLPLGEITAALPPLLDFPAIRRSRCNQLLRAVWEQISAAYAAASTGLAPLRIGIVLGTSTSGIREGEKAFTQREISGEWPADYHYREQEMIAPVHALAEWSGACGPSFVISTACSSSAKALASARRLLRMGVCDLVIAGGVDSLCGLTVNGFAALDSISDAPSQPFSASRCGINIGEGAALFLVSREYGPVRLAGVGENSDAHHISAPDPTGAGAIKAMRQALHDADATASSVGYLNLHGTGTPQNDRMESLAVAEVFGVDLPCSSTKPYTGHCLGAAGAIEAAICWLTLTDANGVLPVHQYDGNSDPNLAPIRLVKAAINEHPIQRAMSNSFAFGGNNIALLLERSE